MIKFIGKHQGRKVLGLGLTQENLDRLADDQPILFDLRKLNPDWDVKVLLFAKPTYQDILRMLDETTDTSGVAIFIEKAVEGLQGG